MKMLISPGYYSNGRLFGAEVSGEYIRRYDPSGKKVTVQGIEHFAQRGDIEGSKTAHAEISAMLERDRPQIFINIDTRGSTPTPQQDMMQTCIGTALSQLGHNLAKKKLTFFDEIATQFLQGKLASLRAMFTTPLTYAFINPDTDMTLYEHLSGQSFAHNIGGLGEIQDALVSVVPSVITATRRRIPYISILAAVNDDGERVVEDEHKRIAFEKAIGFIHTVRQYVESR